MIDTKEASNEVSYILSRGRSEDKAITLSLVNTTQFSDLHILLLLPNTLLKEYCPLCIWYAGTKPTEVRARKPKAIFSQNGESIAGLQLTSRQPCWWVAHYLTERVISLVPKTIHNRLQQCPYP